MAEIQHTQAELSKLAGEVEKFTHVAGKLNPADLGTRPGVRVDELGPGKLWQEGPAYLRQPREGWPITDKVGGAVPKEELRASSQQARAAGAGQPPQRAEGKRRTARAQRSAICTRI